MRRSLLATLLLATFTSTCFAQSPGGVSTGLLMWTKANNGVSTTGSTVTGWTDQTGTNTFTVTGSPQFSSTTINFNPCITYDGASRFTGNTSLTNVTEAFTVGKIVNTSGVSGSGTMIGTVGDANYGYYFHTESGTLYGSGSAAGVYYGTSALGNNISWSVMNGDLSETPAASQQMKVNGIAYANTASGDPAIYSGKPVLGARNTENLLNGSQVAEVVMYNASQAGTNRSKINAYLGLKYGITLGTTSSTYSYLASSGTTFWTGNSTYQHNVNGIGKDNSSGLEQQITTSQDATADLTTLSTDNNFTGASGTHTSVPNDLSYLVMGNNGSSATATQTTNIPAGFCGTRLTRSWLIQKTGTPGSASLQVNIGTTLGASLSAADIVLLIDEDGDGNYSTGTQLQVTASSFSGGLAVFSGVSFDSDNSGTDVFTIGAANFTSSLVSIGNSTTTSGTCTKGSYVYYLSPTDATKGLISFNTNGNSFSPTSVTVADRSDLTASGVTNSGNYYQQTSGSSTIRVANRFSTVVAPGSYTTNGGITVRIYYAAADTMTLMSDAFPAGGIVADHGWYKLSVASATSVLSDMQNGTLTGAAKVFPVDYGTENGVNYAEFLVTSFSTFGYYARTTASVLAVTLTYFKTSTNNCAVSLNWESADESNIASFKIQYSLDGSNYSQVGAVSPKGQGYPYDFEYSPQVATAYYRLQIIGKDGSIAFSSPEFINTGCNSGLLRIWPNPVKDNIFVYTGSAMANQITIMDCSGRILKTIKNQNNTWIDVSGLSQGIYYINVVGDSGIHQLMKFVKL
jgi:Secretion system C-terminal sorting domain